MPEGLLKVTVCKTELLISCLATKENSCFSLNRPYFSKQHTASHPDIYVQNQDLILDSSFSPHYPQCPISQQVPFLKHVSKLPTPPHCHSTAEPPAGKKNPYSFAFSRMSNKRNHTVHSFLNLASYAEHNASMQILARINSLLLFIAEQHSIVRRCHSWFTKSPVEGQLDRFQF